MCGIIGGVVKSRKDSVLGALSHRGPDARGSWAGKRFWLGHTRLAIIDTSSASEQPFVYDDVVLTFNGEIWNYIALKEELEGLGKTFRTQGDTEVLAAALSQWGEGALSRLQGMFAFAWTTDGGETLRVARDRFGETPLHFFASSSSFAFASEVKGLAAMGLPLAGVRWVEPGELLRVDERGVTRTRWYDAPDGSREQPRLGRHEAQKAISGLLELGARERKISDVPVCMLLSGGIDSAAIAFHLAEAIPGIVAYTATLEGSKSGDLPRAREVAEMIGVELREVVVPRPTSSDLDGVIRSIETDSKVQVEIGWACTHLARRVRYDGFRVTFSGEGSDELWASYGMAHHGIVAKGWYDFRRDLFLGQHRKNFARCNKIFMAAGVECRLPFLNTQLAETALSLPQDVVRGSGPKAWKRVLTEAYRGRLPDSVIDRAKMTFQEGMGAKGGLQGACAEAVSDPARYYKAVLQTEYRGLKS